MKVEFIGCSNAQASYGRGDDPRDCLEKGKVYEVEREEVRSWHTLLHLKGIPQSFNSVCFEVVKENNNEH